MIQKVVIVGNGISGVTAARYIRKHSDASITIISAESSHFFARTALMYAFMGSIRDADLNPYERDFWIKNRIDLAHDYVLQADCEAKTVHLAGGRTLEFDVLILATGSKSASPGWSGDHLPGVQGFYSIQDLAHMRENTIGIQNAVVVGGGLTGVEVAEMLISRGIGVTFLVREKGYMDYVLPELESDIIAREIRAHGVDLRLGTQIASIQAGENGRVVSVETGSAERIQTDFMAITTGVKPNIDLAVASGVETNKGILVNEYFETSAPGVFAVGDCAEFRKPVRGAQTIEQLWYTGREQGKVLAQNIVGAQTAYHPGAFYNSAKFFELEYQTYGDITSASSEEAGNRSTRSAVGADEDGRRLVRVEYDADSGSVLGFNLIGVRYRQDVCTHWIREKAHIESIIGDLECANFDPEFSSSIEALVRDDFNQSFAEHAAVPTI